MKKKKSKVIIIDDHPIYVQGLESALEDSFYIKWVKRLPAKYMAYRIGITKHIACILAPKVKSCLPVTHKQIYVSAIHINNFIRFFCFELQKQIENELVGFRVKQHAIAAQQVEINMYLNG